MTKKELTTLHSEKCNVQEVNANLGRGNETRYIVSFSLKAGEMAALFGILSKADTAVQNDLLAFFNNASEHLYS